jgi:WD40 repeat protein
VSAPAVEVAAAVAAERRTPYQGLVPYTEADADWFFGRDEWSEVVGDNLRAYRITVLYGTSGVGKSSVLRAGPLRPLTDEARRNATEFGAPRLLPLVFSAWSLDDPLTALKQAVAAAARGVAPELAGEPPEGPLADVLEAWPERIEGPLLLVLDQFEEFFLYHDRPGDSALDEVATALRRRNPTVHFLLSIREDSLAKLDRFKGHVPGLLDHLLRIDHLDRDAAREAIVRPLERWNQLVAAPGEEVQPEPALVETVLDQVSARQVPPAGGGAGEVTPAHGAEEGIVAPYLQLVLERLWDEERRRWDAQDAREPRLIRLQALDQLGGAERIVSTHLDAALAALPAGEQDVAGKVFRHIVTPSGTKIALRISDLAKLADLPEEQIEPLVKQLTGDVRILRGAGEGRYEIYHDALSGPILDWRARWEERQRRRRERRRLAALVGIAVILAGIAALIAVFAIQARQAQQRALHAQRRAQHALRVESQALSVQAIESLEADPLAGLRIALQAARVAPTREAAGALRAALAADLLRKTLHGPPDPLYSVAFNPNAKLIVTASAGGTAQVWDIARGRSMRIFRGHNGPVYGAAFSPDGHTLVSAGADGTVRLWDVASGRSLGTLARIAGYVSGADFSPDGRTLATGGADGTVRLWDVHTHKQLRALRGHTAVLSVAFSPDGRTLVSADADGTARVWDVASGHRLSVLTGNVSGVYGVALSRDGRLLATAGGDGTVRLWDVQTGREVGLPLRGHTSRVLSVAFSADGRTVATGGADETVRLWDVRTRTLLRTLRGHTNVVRSVAYSRDGRTLASAGADGTTRVWDVISGRNLRTLTGHTGRVRGAVFSPDGKLVATANGGQARISQAATGALLMTLTGHIGSATGGAFSLDDKLVVIASEDGTARVWDIVSGRRLHILRPDHDTGPVYWAAFNKDGRRVVTASDDGTARIWDTARGHSQQILSGHTGPAGGAAFSPDGKLFVTARTDGTARIWTCNVCNVPFRQLVARAVERLASSG